MTPYIFSQNNVNHTILMESSRTPVWVIIEYGDNLTEDNLKYSACEDEQQQENNRWHLIGWPWGQMCRRIPKEAKNREWLHLNCSKRLVIGCFLKNHFRWSKSKLISDKTFGSKMYCKRTVHLCLSIVTCPILIHGIQMA